MIANSYQDTFQENTVTTNPVYGQKYLQYPAWIISILFHPLFISAYVGYYLIFIHPHYFSGFNSAQRLMVLLRIIVNMIVFPLISVLLLKGVGFIDSIFLKTQKDRIIPYIGCEIFFFWMYLVFRNQQEIPAILTTFIFGVFLSSSAALLANIYNKISMHAIGCGGMTGILLVMIYANPSSPVVIPLAISVLISGLVCTSRMMLGSHSQKEIYSGYVLGVACQVVAALCLM